MRCVQLFLSLEILSNALRVFESLSFCSACKTKETVGREWSGESVAKSF